MNSRLHYGELVNPVAFCLELFLPSKFQRKLLDLGPHHCSNRPKPACLSKTLIALLSYGGVPKEFLLDLLESALGDANSVFSNKRAALRGILLLNIWTVEILSVLKMVQKEIFSDLFFFLFTWICFFYFSRSEIRKSIKGHLCSSLVNLLPVGAHFLQLLFDV